MFRVSFLVSFLLAVCPLMGQTVGKKFLKEGDFKMWHTLNLENVSSEGKWVSYSYHYENNQDTVVVKNVLTSLIHSIPKGNMGKFGKDFFVCMIPDSKIKIIDLLSGQYKTIEDIDQFDIVLQGKYIVASKKNGTDTSLNIYIIDYKGQVIDTIPNVSEYLTDPNYKYILYTDYANGKYSVSKYDMTCRSKAVVYSSALKIHTLALDTKNISLAFLMETTEGNNSVNLYKLSGKKLSSFAPDKNGSLRIVKDLGLKISNDADKVFFGVLDATLNLPITSDSVPEIWSTADSLIYPLKMKIAGYKNRPVLSVWITSQQKFEKIAANNREVISLSSSQNYALLYEGKSYGQDGKMHGRSDIYVKSLITGKKIAVIKGHTTDTNMLRLSPFHDKMLYYQNGGWWCYDMVNAIHTELTLNLDSEWDNSKDRTASQLETYGNPAWTNDGKYLFLNDRYDIWRIKSDGTNAIRLTAGKEKGIVFRIDKSNLFFSKDHFQYSPTMAASVNYSKPMVLLAKGSDDKEGYFILENDKTEKPLFYGSFAADQLHRSDNGRYFCRIQSFSQSPLLVYKVAFKQEPQIIARSNSQQDNFYWGKAECMYYQGPKGENLKAALLYPADFNPTKKYPMIVHIYQSMSPYIHHYTNPNSEDDIGFNPTNYTLDGYLVLLPDIAYEMGNPGVSATLCVEAAVQKAYSLGIVDTAKIGLIGHSFGGYEVNYILTKSKIFTTAVAGAGASDTVGLYFTTSETFKGTEAWRYEDQQFRMRQSFYDNKDSYFRNSPIFNAEAINTPLLIWSGKEDEIVPPSQSIAMYHAMRRLHKKSILLLYPRESHTLNTKKNKIDLSIKIKNWFDHFLKNTTAEQWIK